jgi:hypothetical protein
MVRGGFWRRPVSRTYGYNLEVGEHYYAPMTSYLEAERGSRGETPGALTYSERLARKWIYGRRYDSEELRERYSRATSVARGEGVAAAASKSVSFLESEMAARSARAVSELRASSSSQLKASSSATTSASASASATSQSLTSQRQSLLATSQKSTQVSSSVAKSSSVQQSQSVSSSRFSSKQKIEDDVCKKIADIRMSPWSEGQELSEAQAASARARQRILELERELEEITRKAMTSQTKALKTAKQMAMEASLEDEAAMAASTKRSKKVIMESSSKIVSA